MIESASTTTPQAPPWAADELVQRLRAQGTRYHNLHPFHVRMDAGELTRDELQRWVANRFYYQRSIPLKDAAILSNCPEIDVRREWIKRIVDHDGTSAGTGGIEAWLRLGEALGVDRDEQESERRVLPAVRYAVDAYVNFARRRPWIEAVASSLTELFGPSAIRVRLAALEAHYPWIDPAGLEYFRNRLVQAPRDAQYALRLVVERCVTRERQDRAVEALKFKTEMLWAQLEAIERGDTQPADGAGTVPASSTVRACSTTTCERSICCSSRRGRCASTRQRRACSSCATAGARWGTSRRPSRSATRAPTSPPTSASCSAGWASAGWWSMPMPDSASRPYTLVAELTYQCPLHCPYCSNPVDIGGERWRGELETEHWRRVFAQARALGVLQLALTGGEPMLRRDLDELVGAGRAAGLYSTLVTAGTRFTPDRAAQLKEAGLDHVQVSFQSPDPQENDRIAGIRSFEKKIAAARAARELGFPLTINCVLHRQNLDRIEEILQLADDLGAQRLELANTQYYGWAVVNQHALVPTPEQLERGEQAVARFRERVGPRITVLWVLPDLYEDLPKPCMGGWGRTTMVIAPNGDALPCQAAATIPGLEFANVRDHPLAWIWDESEAFGRFRGTDWMQEPCRSCPLGRQEEDFGGCRCQALRLTGDAAATDPVCRFSPHHQTVVAARDQAQTDELVNRTMRRPGLARRR